VTARNRPEMVAKLTDAHRAYLDDDGISDEELQERSREYDSVLCETTTNEWRSSDAQLRREGEAL
jgi:hypothetical protein